MPATELRWTYIRVGLFVALALFVGFAAVAAIGIAGSPFARRATLHGLFDDVSGLAVGSPVEMGGVAVGEVTDIGLPELKNGQVPMRFAIKEDALHRVGHTSVAFTGSHALVGQRFVGLTPRQPGEPPLKDGDEIRTQPAVTTAAMVDEARQTLGQLRGLIGDLRRATSAVARAGDAIDEGKGTLGKLVHDPELYDRALVATRHIDELFDRAANGDGALAALISDRKLAKNVREGTRSLARTLGRVDRGEGVLGRLTSSKQAQARFDKTLANLQLVTTSLADAQGTLGQLIRDPALISRMNALVAQMSSLVADLRRNPQRYLKLGAF